MAGRKTRRTVPLGTSTEPHKFLALNKDFVNELIILVDDDINQGCK